MTVTLTGLSVAPVVLETYIGSAQEFDRVHHSRIPPPRPFLFVPANSPGLCRMSDLQPGDPRQYSASYEALRPRMDVNREELDQIVDGGMRAPLSESDGER